MYNDIKDGLVKLNCKVDHTMKVVCELFIMAKSNEQLDDKLDQCIKLLNTLSYKVDTINKSSIPHIPHIPLAPPPLPPT